MRKSVGAAAVLLTAAAFAVPATVANAQSNTTLNVTITSSGGLSIAAPASADMTNTLGVFTATVNTVTVTDTRNTLAGWTATASMPVGLVNGSSTVAPVDFTYTPGVAIPALLSVAVITPGLPGNLEAARTAHTALIGINPFGGNKTASWSPIVTSPEANFPLAGTYSGDLVHSVV